MRDAGCELSCRAQSTRMAGSTRAFWLWPARPRAERIDEIRMARSWSASSTQRATFPVVARLREWRHASRLLEGFGHPPCRHPAARRKTSAPCRSDARMTFQSRLARTGPVRLLRQISSVDRWRCGRSMHRACGVRRQPAIRRCEALRRAFESLVRSRNILRPALYWV